MPIIAGEIMDRIIQIDNDRALRHYKPSDMDNIIALHEESLKNTNAFFPGPWNDDMKAIDEVYLRPGGCFLVIEEDELIIAMGALKIISEHEAEIKRMRVNPDKQRMGLGQIILAQLILHAKNRGIKRLILDTAEMQIAAQKLYEKNGFVRCGSSVWHNMNLLLYEKHL